jgi:hypothetical protein
LTFEVCDVFAEFTFQKLRPNVADESFANHASTIAGYVYRIPDPNLRNGFCNDHRVLRVHPPAAKDAVVEQDRTAACEAASPSHADDLNWTCRCRAENIRHECSRFRSKRSQVSRRLFAH